MDSTFFCPHCKSEHDEPADALLGHLATCLACAIDLELAAFTTASVDIEPPLAA